MDSNWGNKFLQFINVSKNKEFTNADPYGSLILKFNTDPNVLDELFSLITEYISSIANFELNINWKEEISKIPKKESKKVKVQPYWNNRRKKAPQLPLDPKMQEFFDNWDDE